MEPLLGKKRERNKPTHEIHIATLIECPDLMHLSNTWLEITWTNHIHAALSGLYSFTFVQCSLYAHIHHLFILFQSTNWKQLYTYEKRTIATVIRYTYFMVCMHSLLKMVNTVHVYVICMRLQIIGKKHNFIGIIIW